VYFAEPDVDGTFSTVNDSFGKKVTGDGYRSLAAEVGRLCARRDHRVSLRARPATDLVAAKDVSLEAAIANSGTEPFTVLNAVTAKVRPEERWVRRAANPPTADLSGRSAASTGSSASPAITRSSSDSSPLPCSLSS